MTFQFTATGSSSFGTPYGFPGGAQSFQFVIGMPPPRPPDPPADPGYLPPRGAFVMKGRKLSDGSWYVPGYKQRSLALGASHG